MFPCDVCSSQSIKAKKKKNTIKIFLFGTVFKATEMKIMKTLKREVWDFMGILCYLSWMLH